MKKSKGFFVSWIRQLNIAPIFHTPSVYPPIYPGCSIWYIYQVGWYLLPAISVSILLQPNISSLSAFQESPKACHTWPRCRRLSLFRVSVCWRTAHCHAITVTFPSFCLSLGTALRPSGSIIFFLLYRLTTADPLTLEEILSLCDKKFGGVYFPVSGSIRQLRIPVVADVWLWVAGLLTVLCSHEWSPSTVCAAKAIGGNRAKLIHCERLEITHFIA